MPVYEYECGSCQDRQERLLPVRFRDKGYRCACGGTYRRVLSLPAKRTDGIYSYAEDVGNPDTLERRMYGGDSE